ncbi:MAG: DUF520 family protein, partial [Akkermansiaceae bacterium]|nr:DUF520 family protein [Akkermansiaceae bacterium]
MHLAERTRHDASSRVQRGCTHNINRPISRGGVPKVADSSFDIVSKVDRQEVDNALNQAAKELST